MWVGDIEELCWDSAPMMLLPVTLEFRHIRFVAGPKKNSLYIGTAIQIISILEDKNNDMKQNYENTEMTRETPEVRSDKKRTLFGFK